MDALPSRRGALTGLGAMAMAAVVPTGARGSEKAVEAVGFDAFTVFDPRSVGQIVEQSFPDKGAELSEAWRRRQFDYCWLRTLYGNYADFWQVTGDALDDTFAATKTGLSGALRARLMDAYLRLEPWPDAVAALTALADAGIRLAFVSNMTAAMLDANTRNARLGGLFEAMLSTDAVRAYKPDPRAYLMLEQALNVRRGKVVFAAFGGWDAAGAKSFGLDTFWVDRLATPVERLGARPDGIGSTLTELARYVIR